MGSRGGRGGAEGLAFSASPRDTIPLVNALRQQCLDAVATNYGRNETLVESKQRGVVCRCDCHEVRIGYLLMAEELFECAFNAVEGWENAEVDMMLVGREPL
jgi:hypothetical protein